MYILASKNDYTSQWLFNELKKEYDVQFVTSKGDLSDALNDKVVLDKLQKIFFFHWSFIVPKKIVDEYECINLHTSNLPEGKGGSPIQNQILDGVVFSHVNALRMSPKVDAGPVYNRRPVSLQGSLDDIWLTISKAAHVLIKEIIDQQLKPKEQEPAISPVYKRRTNNCLDLSSVHTLEQFYDCIRMLDSAEYPQSYIEIGKFRLTFSRAHFHPGKSILSDVSIEAIN